MGYERARPRSASKMASARRSMACVRSTCRVASDQLDAAAMPAMFAADRELRGA